MAVTQALAQLLTRIDTWAEGQPELADGVLRPAAGATLVGRAERALDAKIPKSLRALYAWHDGEAPPHGVFDALVRPSLEEMWSAYQESDFQVRWLTLADVARAPSPSVRLGGEGSPLAHLVPFLWVAADPGDDAPVSGARRKVRAIEDTDWVFAVDTDREAVWLFEPGGEGLEGACEQGTLVEWLAPLVGALETATASVPGRRGAAITPPAELMLQLLVDRELVELAPDITVASAAARLAPLLSQKPERHAILAVTRFFEEDDSIAELWADDEMLRGLAREFVS